LYLSSKLNPPPATKHKDAKVRLSLNNPEPQKNTDGIKNIANAISLYRLGYFLLRAL